MKLSAINIIIIIMFPVINSEFICSRDNIESIQWQSHVILGQNWTKYYDAHLRKKEEKKLLLLYDEARHINCLLLQRRAQKQAASVQLHLSKNLSRRLKHDQILKIHRTVQFTSWSTPK